MDKQRECYICKIPTKRYAHKVANTLCVSCCQDSSVMKRAVFEYFGWTACWCCGITHFGVLTVGHTNGDGYQHMNPKGTGRLAGANLYRRLIRDGFKSEYDLRPECFNCNCGSCLGMPGHNALHLHQKASLFLVIAPPNKQPDG